MEEPRGAVPDIAVPVLQKRRLEGVSEALADDAADAVGADQDVGGGEGLDALDRSFEAQVHAQLLAAALQDVEELDPRHPREVVAANAHLLAAMDDVDVVPAHQAALYGAEGLLVGTLQVGKGLLGENAPPAEGVVARVALEDRHLVARLALLHQQAEVEPRRSAADDRDLHGCQRGGMSRRRPSLDR